MPRVIEDGLGLSQRLGKRHADSLVIQIGGIGEPELEYDATTRRAGGTRLGLGPPACGDVDGGLPWHGHVVDLQIGNEVHFHTGEARRPTAVTVVADAKGDPVAEDTKSPHRHDCAALYWNLLHHTR